MSYTPPAFPSTQFVNVRARTRNQGYAFDRDVPYGRAYGSALGDWIQWGVALDDGTYEMEIAHYLWESGGIGTVSFNGVEAGTFDTYYPIGQTPNRSSTLSNIDIPRAGLYRVRITTTGKHPDSSGHYLLLCGEWGMWREAD